LQVTNTVAGAGSTTGGAPPSLPLRQLSASSAFAAASSLNNSFTNSGPKTDTAASIAACAALAMASIAAETETGKSQIGGAGNSANGGDTTENPGGGREPGGGDPAAAAQRARYGNSQAQWGGMIGKSSTDGGPGYSFDSIPLVADTPGLAQAGQKDDQTHRALVAQMALKLGQRTTGRSTWCPGPSSLWTT
jgi:hypothetical protein